MNYDNWKLSNPIDDGHGTSMVSSCCGDEIMYEVPTCTECGSFEIGEKWAGDEGWTICDNCRAIEQGYDYLDICSKCECECNEIEDYEYEQIQKENYEESMRDEY